MKRVFVVVLGVLVFFACEKSDDDFKSHSEHVYLPSILQGEGLVITLTFDNRSRIVQLGEVADNGEFARLYTFRYTGEKMTSAEAIYFSVAIEGGYNYSENFKFVYNQDQILVEKHFLDNTGFSQVTNDVLEVDQEGKLLSAQNLQISYDERGNMVKVIDHDNVSEVTYDNNKGAFLNVNNQPWVLYYIMKLGNFYRVNNPIEIKSFKTNMDTLFVLNRVFEYNSAGFPIEYVESSSEDEETDMYFIDYLQLYHEN